MAANTLSAATINFPNFSSSAGFVFNASSTTVDPHIVSNELQITTHGQSGEVTAAWYSTPVFLKNGFTTTIQYQSTSAGSGFGNTWAFVIQNDPRGRLRSAVAEGLSERSGTASPRRRTITYSARDIHRKLRHSPQPDPRTQSQLRSDKYRQFGAHRWRGSHDGNHVRRHDAPPIWALFSV